MLGTRAPDREIVARDAVNPSLEAPAAASMPRTALATTIGSGTQAPLVD